MNDDREDQADVSSDGNPPQFSIRTLMIAVTAVAIFISLVTWWGFYPVVFIIAGALGTFLGLLACSYTGLGFTFDDLRWDIPKCLMVACATIASVYLVPVSQSSYLLAVYPLIPPFCYWLSMKCAWSDLDAPQILFTAVAAFFTWALVVYATYMLVGL